MTIQTITRILTGVTIVGLAAACGADEEEATSQVTQLEGNYAVTEWIANPVDCGEGGESVRDLRPGMLRVGQRGAALEVALCTRAGDCTYAWRLPHGSPGEVWLGKALHYAPADGDQCCGAIEKVELTGQRGQIEVVVEQLAEAQFARTECMHEPDANRPDGKELCVPGVCSLRDAEAACQCQPCVAREVITATLVTERGQSEPFDRTPPDSGQRP